MVGDKAKVQSVGAGGIRMILNMRQSEKPLAPCKARKNEFVEA